MKRLLMLLTVLGMIPVSGSWAADPPPAVDEKALVEKAVRDYIDGWYKGSVERMMRALHPDLVKRHLVPLPNGRVIVDSASADTMLELTRVGYGKTMAKPGQKVEVVVLDIYKDTASAKSVAPDYVDYLHLVKIEGEWKVLNVLWAPVKDIPQAPAP
jgi:hypothetical protein